jgi:hypothetical protein
VSIRKSEHKVNEHTDVVPYVCMCVGTYVGTIVVKSRVAVQLKTGEILVHVNDPGADQYPEAILRISLLIDRSLLLLSSRGTWGDKTCSKNLLETLVRKMCSKSLFEKRVRKTCKKKFRRTTCSKHFFGKLVQKTCSKSLFEKLVRKTCSKHMFEKRVRKKCSKICSKNLFEKRFFCFYLHIVFPCN